MGWAMASIFEQLMRATSVAQVADLIVAIQSDGAITWRAVDDNDNNLATINLGSDPAAGVIERITNAFDAVLEQEFMTRASPLQPPAPRAATERWFGIPGGRLANLDQMPRLEAVALSERVEVTLRDSDREDRPTVDVRDTGIGIKTEEFGSSILSLHKSRKLKKLYLAGAFGQGGSTALAYSVFTIIVSRPNIVPDQEDRSGKLAFTIVRFDPGDAQIDKHGVYQYMVDHKTGHPITLPAPDDFPSGTLVRHISMDLGRYKSTMTAPTGSLWFLAHNYLFDPILPFKLVETRRSKTAAQRTSSGNFRLLSQGNHTEYQRSATLTFRSGSVTITWWVLVAEGDQPRNRITQYVMPSKPIIVTYNGQKQGDFPNTIIKNDLKLPYLERYLVVHVDCDQLDNESRRQLFPTTQETIRDTPIGDDLKRLIFDTLIEDKELERLDSERKKRYLQRADNAAIENIRRRPSNRVKAFALGGGGGGGPQVRPPETNENTNSQPRIPVVEPPTFIDIASPDPRKVYAAKRFTIRFRTDADPAYFLKPDSFIAIIDPPSFGQYNGTTNVRDGYGVAYFNAADTLDVGAEASVTLEVRPRRAQSLHASCAVEVVPLPDTAKLGEKGSVATPNINPQWVTEGEAFWQDNAWTRQSVAKVVSSGDSVEIFVSAANEKLASLVARGQRRGIEAVDAVKDFYLEHVAFHAFLESLQQVDQPTPSDEDEAGSRSERNPELARTCETVCGIIDAVFELLVMGRRDAAADAAPVLEDVPE